MAYDDGSAEWFNWSPGDAGAASAWAVQFGPVDTPFVLCGARFAVSRIWPDAAHTPVRVSVYAADGPGGLPGTLLKSRAHRLGGQRHRRLAFGNQLGARLLHR